ncbi:MULTISPECIES: hypothetical protein [Streptomyces]|uniref:hypothetical protein n=1 Tax=Streptomyces TaxID=1883 RepID=UPI00114CC32E|nr:MULTISPECIES: hypothetical protein [unclassified Streptomyces]MYT11017.1 hypothetical protein [Streptomyces sp. SID4951]
MIFQPERDSNPISLSAVSGLKAAFVWSVPGTGTAFEITQDIVERRWLGEARDSAGVGRRPGGT